MKFDEPDTTDTNALLTDHPITTRKKTSLTSRFLDDKRSLSHPFIHLFSLYVINGALVLALVWSLQRECVDPSLRIYSPANEYVEYQTEVFHDNIYDLSPYQADEGGPTDEMDEMWSDLYGGGGFMMIMKDAADKLPNKTAEVPGKPGEYIITLEVFHQLHCLNVLRKHLYPARFPEYRIRDDNPFMEEHLGHCIDRLRQGIMCAVDTGTVYWSWREEKQAFKIDMRTTHSCRNFDKIRDWAFSISSSPSDIDPIIVTT